MTERRTLNLIGNLLILSALMLLFCGNSAIADDCSPSGNLKYICGLKNAEDIVQLGNTQWLVTSGMNGQMLKTNDKGHIYLVNRIKKTFEIFFPGKNPKFHQDKKMFGNCPGPVNPEKFSPEGLAVRQQSPGHFRLYATCYGGREAIEVFDIYTKRPKPSISWAGCVLLPKKVFADSVAILSDGGFVTTDFMDPAKKNPFDDIYAGKITGCVYEWHPHGVVKAVKGTELSGANGIAVSRDNKWVYVAAYGTREIVRYDRTKNPVKLERVGMSIRPDNIHWSHDGLLYVAGDTYVPPDECKNPPCQAGWSVFSIDPNTLKTKRIVHVDQTATMSGASTGIAVGNLIWVSNYKGDRIGYLPRP